MIISTIYRPFKRHWKAVEQPSHSRSRGLLHPQHQANPHKVYIRFHEEAWSLLRRAQDPPQDLDWDELGGYVNWQPPPSHSQVLFYEPLHLKSAAVFPKGSIRAV